MKNTFGILFFILMSTTFSWAEPAQLNLPRSTRWCTGSKIANVWFGSTKPENNPSGDEGFFLCVAFDENGNTTVIRDSNSKSYNWLGEMAGSTEAGSVDFDTIPVLLKTKSLKDGRIAYMYKLKPLRFSKSGVLEYRAGIGIVFDPKTKTWANYATFLVHNEDYWERNTWGADGHYSNIGEKTSGEFDGKSYRGIRLTREFGRDFSANDYE